MPAVPSSASPTSLEGDPKRGIRNRNKGVNRDFFAIPYSKSDVFLPKVEVASSNLASRFRVVLNCVDCGCAPLSPAVLAGEVRPKWRRMAPPTPIRGVGHVHVANRLRGPTL